MGTQGRTLLCVIAYDGTRIYFTSDSMNRGYAPTQVEIYQALQAVR